jgi:hypothetical protein
MTDSTWRLIDRQRASTTCRMPLATIRSICAAIGRRARQAEVIDEASGMAAMTRG